MDDNEKKEKAKAVMPGKIRAFFTDIRGEGRKIIWPSKAELKNKTVTVIITSLLFAALIFCMDSVYNLGLTLFATLLS